ncbi:MAG: hypothetical protein KBF73_05175 [Flavobacteriales bacterium]|nr:hypothetical protein [Flavobacteriales bacterium]
MSTESLLKEIMEEVESLNRSIQECCPEIISVSKYPSIQEMGDEMNELIEYRIKLLTENSKSVKGSEKL